MFSMRIYCKYIPAGSSFSFHAPDDVLMETGTAHVGCTQQGQEEEKKGVEVDADFQKHKQEG